MRARPSRPTSAACCPPRSGCACAHATAGEWRARSTGRAGAGTVARLRLDGVARRRRARDRKPYAGPFDRPAWPAAACGRGVAMSRPPTGSRRRAIEARWAFSGRATDTARRDVPELGRGRARHGVGCETGARSWSRRAGCRSPSIASLEIASAESGYRVVPLRRPAWRHAAHRHDRAADLGAGPRALARGRARARQPRVRGPPCRRVGTSAITDGGGRARRRRLYSAYVAARSGLAARRVPDRLGGRPRRHGRGLPRLPARAGAGRRAEGDRAGAARRRRRPRALPGRGARGGRRRSPERDPRLRGGRGRRRGLHRDAVRRRQRPALAGARRRPAGTRPRPPATSRRPARRWTRSTPPASSTATSSPRTC